MTITTHTFNSTQYAYRSAMVDGAVKDGDVLVVPSERVVGIMADGYPCGVTKVKGAFHTYTEDLAEAHDGRYIDSLVVAESAKVNVEDCLPATVKDAAAAIRKDLRAAFPGTKFSVRMGAGTASTYIDVTWTDGPNDDMVRNVTDQYEEFGSPVEGVCRDRRISIPTLLAAQGKIRTVLPKFEAYDENGRWIADGPGTVPIFYLGGWRFGGGDHYSALAMVADMLILNPRKGPVA